jgi:hypothetical protein
MEVKTRQRTRHIFGKATGRAETCVIATQRNLIHPSRLRYFVFIYCSHEASGADALYTAMNVFFSYCLK